jgi:superoxide dismutase, Fe-Mn family
LVKNKSGMKFELPDLPYKTNALEPNISVKTLEYHYGKLQKDYVDNLNSSISETKFQDIDLETIIKIADGPVYNYAAQVWNHTFYFEALTPGKNTLSKGPFADVIKNNFGSISFFKKAFAKAANFSFVSGWIWMVLTQTGEIKILHENHVGNPLRKGFIPLLNCDLWEHAYYLDYQNRRTDYLNAFHELINWEIVEKRYNEAILILN